MNFFSSDMWRKITKVGLLFFLFFTLIIFEIIVVYNPQEPNIKVEIPWGTWLFVPTMILCAGFALFFLLYYVFWQIKNRHRVWYYMPFFLWVVSAIFPPLLFSFERIRQLHYLPGQHYVIPISILLDLVWLVFFIRDNPARRSRIEPVLAKIYAFIVGKIVSLKKRHLMIRWQSA